MIDDLVETLRQLLIQKAGLNPTEVDISFDIPTRDWATSSAATRPTVNLYLYDIRENLRLREMYWDQDAQAADRGQVKLKRRPLRMAFPTWSPAGQPPPKTSTGCCGACSRRSANRRP